MMRVVGRPTPRVEGELKVAGKAQNDGDLKLPNMLWGRCLRSSISAGRIKSIDFSKALKVPGVNAVIAGKDVPGLRIGRCIYDTPVVADACGVRTTDLPVTSEKVYKALWARSA